MVGCVLSQLKPSELYILSCGKDRGLQASALGVGLFHSYECRVPRALSYIYKLYEVFGQDTGYIR